MKNPRLRETQTSMWNCTFLNPTVNRRKNWVNFLGRITNENLKEGFYWECKQKKDDEFAGIFYSFARFHFIEQLQTILSEQITFIQILEFFDSIRVYMITVGIRSRRTTVVLSKRRNILFVVWHSARSEADNI